MDVGHGREITLSHSQETLRMAKENDQSLKVLWIGGTVIDRDDEGNEVVAVRTQGADFRLPDNEGVFNPIDDKEFTSLGEYIAENTHLMRLVHIDGGLGWTLSVLEVILQFIN